MTPLTLTLRPSWSWRLTPWSPRTSNKSETRCRKERGQEPEDLDEAQEDADRSKEEGAARRNADAAAELEAKIVRAEVEVVYLKDRPPHVVLRGGNAVWHVDPSGEEHLLGAVKQKGSERFQCSCEQHLSCHLELTLADRQSTVLLTQKNERQVGVAMQQGLYQSWRDGLTVGEHKFQAERLVRTLSHIWAPRARGGP